MKKNQRLYSSLCCEQTYRVYCVVCLLCAIERCFRFSLFLASEYSACIELHIGIRRCYFSVLPFEMSIFDIILYIKCRNQFIMYQMYFNWSLHENTFYWCFYTFFDESSHDFFLDAHTIQMFFNKFPIFFNVRFKEEIYIT